MPLTMADDNSLGTSEENEEQRKDSISSVVSKHSLRNRRENVKKWHTIDGANNEFESIRRELQQLNERVTKLGKEDQPSTVDTKAKDFRQESQSDTEEECIVIKSEPFNKKV